MKDELRKKYLNIRKNINNKEELDNIIFNKVINNSKIKDSKKILIYVSLKYEIDTINLIKYFLNNNIMIAVPKIDNDTMNFYYINSLSELDRGYFNILEPISNDIVTDYSDFVCITPGVCFDLENYRIGYGKGFYDKFFSKNNVYSIGLCYKKCLINKIEHNKYDKKVNEIITD